MTVDKKTLRDYLKTVFTEAESLSTVKSWHNARPSVLPGSPFGWVRPLGGANEPGVTGSRKTTDSFEVVLVVKSGNWNSAEDSALGLEAAVTALVDADPTLNSQVQYAYVSRMESLQFTEENISFSAWKITVSTWRFS